MALSSSRIAEAHVAPWAEVGAVVYNVTTDSDPVAPLWVQWMLGTVE